MTEPADLLQSRANRLVEDHLDLHRALVEMRKKHELSQEEVGLRMGVSQATVAKFERLGANPTLATIRRYAMAVGAVIDTQVVDDCLEERQDRAQFAAVLRGVDVGRSDVLNYRRVPSVVIPATWTRAVLSTENLVAN